MKLDGKKIVVTGSDGFIGSHLVESLVARGCDVRALCLYNSFGSRGWLDTASAETQNAIEVVMGDVRDPHAVRSLLDGADVVFHLAALIAIPYSYLAPESYVDTNVRGTLNVVQAARDLGLERVIHTSTSEVYGTAQFVPITEKHPVHGQSPYSASKIGADQMAISFHRSFDVPVTVARPFNTYGPRQSARAVIPTIIGQIAAGERKIRLGALTPTRDFTFVTDTCNGFMALAESDAAVGDVVNFGSEFEISIGDTAQVIAEQMGADIEIEEDPDRIRPANSEVERLFASTEKLRGLTDWRPAFGGRDGFGRGIAETAAWFQKPENLARYRTDIYNV